LYDGNISIFVYGKGRNNGLMKEGGEVRREGRKVEGKY
jgi:hypothetical protein